MRPPATDPPLILRTPAAASAVLTIVALCLATSVATAAVEVSSVSIDGRVRHLPTNAEAGGSTLPLRIPSTARNITFNFKGQAEDDTPKPTGTADASAPDRDASLLVPRPRATRLRYRLDGIDAGWRDTTASGRMDLRFEDDESGPVDGDIKTLDGESPGWSSTVEESRFLKHSITATVPPLANAIRINFVSHYPGPSIGVIGIDDVEVEVARPDGTTIARYPLTIELGDTPFGPMISPTPWVRSGTRMAMSQVRMRNTPKPHPILVIVDDEVDRYGGWYVSPKMAISPGDRVTVSFSAAWSMGDGGESMCSYENPKPGTYFFRVGGFYPNGEPSGIEAVLPIEVYVPWHLRREVWAGAAMLGLAGVVTAGRAASARRMKRRLEEIEREHALEQERARIARDLHDDVGAGLTEIAVQTDWLRRDVERLRDEAITGRAHRVCQSAVELIRSVDAIVWAVNPKNDTLDRFVGYVTQSADQFVRGAGLEIRLDVPDEVPAAPLPGRVRHNLVLIVREAVNNAVKHAAANLVRLGLSIDDRTVTITVEDDGRGFDATASADDGRHSGLANMRRRADDVGGSLTITSRPGAGTRVEITAPLA